MGYFGSIRIVSSKTTKKGDNYEKVELESEVFFTPGEVPFNVEGIQESFVSVTERMKNMIENKILGWTTAPQLPTDFKPAAEIVEQLDEDGKNPPYNAQKREWNYCDRHPEETIWHESKNKPGVMYQCCFKCDELLQRDGTRKKREMKKPMGVKE